MPRWLKNTTVGVLVFVFLALSLSTNTTNDRYAASAASLVAYPSSCLGGWEIPGGASGEPERMGQSDGFSDSNSAVLHNRTGQIYCGYFDPGEKHSPPTRIVLHVSWDVSFAENSPASGDGAEWQETLNEEKKGEEAPNREPEPKPAEPALPQEQPQEKPAEPQSESSAPAAFRFVPEVHAEDQVPQGVSANPAFMAVSFSVDGGTEWKPLAEIAESNWRGFSIEIPVASWDDVRNLQFQFASLPTGDAPTVLLDGLWVEAEYDQSFMDAARDGLDSVLDAASDVGNVIGDAINSVVDVIDDAMHVVVEPNVVEPSPEQVVDPTPTPSTPQGPPHFTFALENSASLNIKDIQWLPTEDVKEYKAEAGRKMDDARLRLLDEHSFELQSACRKGYLATLLFKERDGYLKDPSLALFNKAFECHNGSLTQKFTDRDVPPTLEDGVYYLTVADQGNGPTIPRDEVFGIKVTRVKAE